MGGGKGHACMAVFLVCNASAISNTRSVGRDAMYSDNDAWKRLEWLITALRSLGLRPLSLSEPLPVALAPVLAWVRGGEGVWSEVWGRAVVVGVV